MSEAGQENKVTAILPPGYLNALHRVGLKLTNGKGMKKTTLIRDACRYFIQQHGEKIVIPVKMESELR